MSEPVILISGGGAIGLTLAALLDRIRHDCRVILVEPRDLPRWDPSDVGLRVYALSRASEHVLERAGAWASIEARRASPYERMRVWEGASPNGFGSIGFDSADVGEPNLGYIVEDVLIRDALLEQLAGSERVRIVGGTTVESIEIRRDEAVATLGTGEVVRAALVVAADGGRSPVRTQLGLATASRDYGQHAIVTHVETERPHDRTAWQRFVPGGPVALLPLLDGRSSIVWSLPTVRAEELAAASDDVFRAALEDASGGVLGRLGALAPRGRFPLQILHAIRYCCPRGVLVGDAAHVVHPLAGQGMNLGLADAGCLAATIDAALEAGLDAGDVRVLRRYERERKADNLDMLLGLDALHHLFRLPGPAALIRAAGLSAMDAAGPAKRLFARRALGLHLLREAPRGTGGRARA